MAVGPESQGVPEGSLDLVIAQRGGLKALLGLSDLVDQPGLFALEEVERDGTCVVGLEQLGLFVSESGDAGALGLGLLRAGAAGVFKVVADVAVYGVAAVRLELDRGVEVLDFGLDVLGADVALGTAGAAVTPGAEEVEVRAAVAGRLGQTEPAAAAGAEDAALEVVTVLTVLLARHGMGEPDGLGLRPDLARHECLVAPRVFGAVPADDADVVGVLEQFCHRRTGQLPLGVLRCGPRAQAPLGQGFTEGVQGVGAGGVGLERPGHQRGTLGVDSDGANLAPVDLLADVAVAQGGTGGGAAGLCLLGESFHAFGGQVARVELGDRRHDPVQQLAGGRLVDVLGDRDKLGAVLGDLEDKVRVIAAVAGEPVELVDDHVVHVTLLPQPHDHRLQTGTRGELG